MGGEPPVAQDPFDVSRKLASRRAELKSLRSDYGDYEFEFAKTPPNELPRFGAVRTRGDGIIWALITSDADEMRQILDAALT